MDSNRRPEEQWGSRNRPENQRSGQDQYRSSQEQYRHSSRDWQERGPAFQNRQQGYNQDPGHYGSRPDSAYRNPDINFGDQASRSGNRFSDRNRSYQGEGTSSQSPYSGDHTRPEQHYDTRFWTERNRFKDDDYRYRSGNRDTWQSAENLDYEEEDRARHRGDFRHQEEGFFDRMGNRISQAWRNMTHEDDEDRPGNYSSRNRDYASGSRWTQDRDQDRYRQNRGYREDDWY
ncbi:MAG: hypothetical protein ACO1O1_06590 [Adhaeribacter sp.]